MESSLSSMAQLASVVAIALIAAITGVFKYLKTEKKQETTLSRPEAFITNNSIDSKLLKELIETLREVQDDRGRDAKKGQRLSQDLREAINELNESIIVQTDTTMNLVRFINREKNKNKEL
jgi:hypothetical protein